MDPLTHGLVGSVAAQSITEREHLRPVAFAGFVSAMLADLDFFIHNPADPLLHVEMHRQFTHSLLFMPVGALVASLLLWWFLRNRLTFGQLYLVSLVSYSTAGLLDACTSYGTALLWPFSETRFAWNLVSIADPLLTAGIFLLLVVALCYRSRRTAWIASVWVVLYLMAGMQQRDRAEAVVMDLAAEREHRVERLVVKPTIGNLLLWRTTYEAGGSVYADGIRVVPFGGASHYKGTSAPLVRQEELLPEIGGSVLYDDLLRFSRLSDGWLIRHPDKPDVIGDARYSMLPTSLTPLWGVRIDPSRSREHAPFLYFRDAGPDVRRKFFDMVAGRSAD